MHDIVQSELFRTVKQRILAIVDKLKTIENVAIFATADLESIVSLAFLESAMIDANIPYSRKFYTQQTTNQRARSTVLNQPPRW